MKLSFSTKGWPLSTLDDYIEKAKLLGFSGLELHNVNGKLFTVGADAFHEYRTSATKRRLFDEKISLPCIDTVADLTAGDACLSEIATVLSYAENLGIPYLRLRTVVKEAAAVQKAKAVVAKVLPDAEKRGITLLIETVGVFAKTSVLRDFLEDFASDGLAALWNASATYFDGKESPEDVIKNLGAYVRHVHLTDAVCDGETIKYCLLGEGDLPIRDMMLALRSVNYDGFFSFVWDTSWLPELTDMEILLSQFADVLTSFGDTAKKEKTFYYNKTHTGKFVWKKDALIDETFSGVLDRMVEDFPDQYAFKYTTLDYTRTYRQFRDDVDTFARALVALGVRAGTHVAVWASNVPEWYIAFWATVKIGAVLVSVNTAYKIFETEYLLKQSDTHTLIMTAGAKDTDYGKIMEELCPELQKTKTGAPLHAKRLPFLRHIITVGYAIPGAMTFAEALAEAPKVSPEEIRRMAARVDPDDVCNMQYTSGTTGFPKGVMLTHRNIVNNGKCIGDRMDLSTADRMMIQVPMFHCFGMVLAMTASMTHGTTLYPLPYFSPKPALSCIHNEHITAFHGVPTMFIALLEHPDFPKTDFSYMRTGIMAGSPCPISTMQDVVGKMHMSEITIVYGQTEASPGCTMSSTDDPLEVRVGTVGRPLPEIECRIVDPETGKECPDGTPGEFLARGYNIMKGYYKMPKATASAVDADGWLHTGDLAARTPDGNFRITGRLKDMIIRGGENIYPKEIEEVIYTFPKVRDVQVIGVPDEQYGEEILAEIILKDGETATADEVRAYVSTLVARHKVPRYIDFVDEFPMNAAGKILKYKMREEAVKKFGLEKANDIVTA